MARSSAAAGRVSVSSARKYIEKVSSGRRSPTGISRIRSRRLPSERWGLGNKPIVSVSESSDSAVEYDSHCVIDAGGESPFALKQFPTREFSQRPAENRSQGR